MKIPQNLTLASQLSRSLKVTGSNTDRLATYDFLLVILSNYGPISYRFRGKRRFLSKIAIFFNLRLYKAPADEVTLGIL